MLIQSGMFKKETFVVPITKDNELQIALLLNNINHIKTLWFVTLTYIATAAITLDFFVQNKSKVFLVVISVISIILMPFILTSYLTDMDSIDRIILSLTHP